MIQHHFVDSLSCALSPVMTPDIRLLDIGTGAGFPGIPLKIYEPTLHVTAVDAVTKKILFLRHLCRGLALEGVECIAARLDPQMSSSRADGTIAPCNVVVSRAVGAFADLVRLSAAFLAPGGCMLLQRGQRGEDELRVHQPLLRTLGLQVVDVTTVHFSFYTYARCLIALGFQQAPCGEGKL